MRYLKFIENMTPRSAVILERSGKIVKQQHLVYAGNGRELMGVKFPVSVPYYVVKRNINY